MNKIFRNKKFNPEKLLKFGFVINGEKYTYSVNIMKGAFCLNISIDTNLSNITTRMTEVDTGEIYTLHLTNSEGTFVGSVRDEYNKVLQNVADKCCETSIFKSEYTNKVIEYIRKKYNDEIEYLWEKFPDNAVARRKDNSKWYLAILTVKKDRLGFDSDEKIEIIDIRAKSEDLPKLIKRGNIYPGYHMNKKHWITIILDGSVDINEIYEKIDESYTLAKNK